MLKIKNIIISELSSLDRDTGNISLFNVFTNIVAPAFPLIINKIVATVILERGQSDGLNGNVELIIKQKAETAFNQNIPYVFNDKSYGVSLIVKINNFIIKEPGDVEFIVKCDTITMSNSIAVVSLGSKM
jgi:hypothetical protein